MADDVFYSERYNAVENRQKEIGLKWRVMKKEDKTQSEGVALSK